MDRVFRIVELLHRYKTDKLEVSEQKELEEWFGAEGNRKWAEQLYSEDYEARVLQEFRKYNSITAYQRFTGKKTVHRSWVRWSWVAAVILPLVVAIALLLKQANTGQESFIPVAQEVVTAGGHKAVLTLANGRQVSLGKTLPVYTRDAKGVFVKADSSNLVYEKKEQETESLVYNELYVPRKGEYSLQLSDGTRIYLNADSRLKYPETFGKQTREVELSGEAYFEVRKDIDRPFIVKVGDMRVRVLGTVFNINAYDEMPDVKTTLVNGKVNVECPGKSLELAPGEQASLNKTDEGLYKAKVNVALYTGWKDGLFKFERESLENIMKVLERWYDVQVFFYNEELKHSLFSGDLKKYDNIEQHLQMLELTTSVRFYMNGNNIFVCYKN